MTLPTSSNKQPQLEAELTQQLASHIGTVLAATYISTIFDHIQSRKILLDPELLRRMASQGLPLTPNIDGRAIWEPPILDYSQLIGDEQQKLREEVLGYTDGNVVRTSAILDAWSEAETLWLYTNWVVQHLSTDSDSDGGDEKRDAFFVGLWTEIMNCALDAMEDMEKSGVDVWKSGEGEWVVADRPDESIFK